MANCSIPSLNPASGRISTRSLRRSRKGNSTATSFFAARSRANATRSWASSFFNAQRLTLNVQRSTQTVESWMSDCLLANPFGVGRWAFSTMRRVKGAWWPSRSSKPLSSRLAGRGRFDSYPLRLDFSTLNAQRSTRNVQFRQLDVGRWTLSVGRFLLLNSKGGEPHVARADS
jgi:hypothetical protein